MFSLRELLGSGAASSQGEQFFDEAVEAISNVRADAAALVCLDSRPAGLDSILRTQSNKVSAIQRLQDRQRCR